MATIVVATLASWKFAVRILAFSCTDLDAATEEESGRARAADVEILVGAIQNIHAMTRVGVGDPFHCPHTRTHIYAHTYAHTRVCAHGY